MQTAGLDREDDLPVRRISKTLSKLCIKLKIWITSFKFLCMIIYFKIRSYTSQDFYILQKNKINYLVFFNLIPAL